MKVWCKEHFLPAHAYAHDNGGWVGYACDAWIAYPHLLKRCVIGETP